MHEDSKSSTNYNEWKDKLTQSKVFPQPYATTINLCELKAIHYLTKY